jgi:hypothetical protein
MFRKIAVLMSMLLSSAALNGGQVALAGPPIAAGSPAINFSPDPNAMYGNCLSGGSTLGLKLTQITNVGETLSNILAITVLKCQPFAWSGPHKVPCPSGSPFAYCTNSGNDGLGNDITLGVLKLDKTTDPLRKYTGCPAGTAARSKLRLLRLADYDPREVKSIVTLACGPATAADQRPPSIVKCPPGPDPYRGFCLGTANDGFGNAVTIGVVKATDAGDPYALYGECVTPRPGYLPGFLSKSTLVTGVSRSLEHVRTIDILACTDHINFPQPIPDNHLEVTSCTNREPALAGRYDYCVWGTDVKGNAVFAGVNSDN